MESDDADEGLIAGRFRIGGLLGSGGSASVFEAVDTLSGDPVAVKLLHPHLSDSEHLRDAFLDEARHAEKAQHANIAAILDVGVHDQDSDSVVWIAQELAPGVTLGEWVRSNGPLSAAQVIDVGIAVLGALAAAHAAGVVHRDVSPSNVMIDVDNGRVASVRLLDFGLADVAGRTTVGGDVLRSAAPGAPRGVIGNVRYASPEQLRGELVDERGDVYQVGGVLYFALTGAAPFERGDRDAIARAHLEAPPPVPSVRVAQIPPALDRIVVRAMLKTRSDRFASARAMADALTTVRDGLVSRPVALGARPQGSPDPSAAVTPASDATAVTRVIGGNSPVRSLTPAPRSELPPSSPEPEDEAPTGSRLGWVIGFAVTVLVVVALVAMPSLVGGTAPEPTRAPSAEATPEASPTQTPTPSAPPAPQTATAAVPPFGSLADTRAAIEAAGFVVGTIDVVDSREAADTVLASDPAPGVFATLGSAVALTVASGFNEIPAVMGMTREVALQSIRDAGFVAVETTLASDDTAAGHALATQPAPGRQRLGSVVTVVIAVPVVRPQPTPTLTPQPTPTAEPTPDE